MRISEQEYAAYLARQGQPLPPATQEAQFQSQVVRLARSLGLCVYHTYDSRKSASGFPDLCIVDPRPVGRRPEGDLPIFMVELKTAKGKLTHAQEIWLRSLDGKRVVAEVWKPQDMQDIVARLKGEGA